MEPEEKRETRTGQWLTVRLTPSERAALVARVGTAKGAITAAVREAIAPLVEPVDQERQAPAR